MTRSTSCNSDKKAIRKKIDAVDRNIVLLLEKRLSFVLELKNLKQRLTDKKREEEILMRISSPYIQEIYRAIFKSAKKMLKHVK